MRCFRCSQYSDYARDCTTTSDTTTTLTKQTIKERQARVYNMVQTQAKANPIVMIVQLLMHTNTLYALINFDNT